MVGGAAVVAGLTPKHGRAWVRLGNAATLLTIIGVVIGLLALALAIAFNWGNRRELTELGHSIRKHVTDTLAQHLPHGSVDAEKLLVGDEANELQGVIDTEPDLDAPAFIARLPNKQRLGVYEADGIPLRVIADLVEHWRKIGRTGKWRIGNLEFAVRAVGQGNHPWLLKFRDDPVMWRVAYGGRGRTGEQATVRELPISDEEPSTIFQ